MASTHIFMSPYPIKMTSKNPNFIPEYKISLFVKWVVSYVGITIKSLHCICLLDEGDIYFVRSLVF